MAYGIGYSITYGTDGRVLTKEGADTGFSWDKRGRRVSLFVRGGGIFGSYASQGAATRAVLRYLSWCGLPKQEPRHE